MTGPERAHFLIFPGGAVGSRVISASVVLPVTPDSNHGLSEKSPGSVVVRWLPLPRKKLDLVLVMEAAAALPPMEWASAANLPEETDATLPLPGVRDALRALARLAEKPRSEL